MTEVVRMTEAEARSLVAEVEKQYPDFADIFANSEIDICCKVDEVASVYGWGDATGAWSECDSLRWLLGDR